MTLKVGGVEDGLDAEVVGGDDAVVQDVLDVGLGGEAAHSGGVVLIEGRGTGGGDTEVFAALEEAGACRVHADFSVAGDGGVAVDDKVSMREDGGCIRQCVALRDDAGCGGEGNEDRDGESESATERGAAYECRGDRLFEKEARKDRHDCTSLFCAGVCIGAYGKRKQGEGCFVVLLRFSG